MLKRVLWLLSFVLLGLAIWRWWQDRTEDVFEPPPQLAASVPPPDETNHAGPLAPAEPPPPAPPAAALPAQPATPTEPPADPPLDQPHAVALEPPHPVERALALGAPGEQSDEGAGTAPDDAQPSEESAEDGQPAEEEREEEDASDGVITAYCVRCKTKRDMLDPQLETTENGRRAARGTCPVCSGTMFTFLKERAPGA